MIGEGPVYFKGMFQFRHIWEKVDEKFTIDEHYPGTPSPPVPPNYRTVLKPCQFFYSSGNPLLKSPIIHNSFIKKGYKTDSRFHKHRQNCSLVNSCRSQAD